MTFVEQGVKQPMLSCFLAEHDNLSKSSKISSSTVERSKLDEHNRVQDLFAVRTTDCNSKGSTADGSTLQLTASPSIPHWMSSKPELEVKISTSTKNGFTANMAISKSQNLPTHSQESLKSFGTLSFPSVGIDSERRVDSRIVMQSRADVPNSKHLFHKQLPSASVLSNSLQASCREEQREDSKVDLVSFLLQKQQNQLVKECPKTLPGLPPGHAGGVTTEMSSWVSKFPFQIGPEADFGRSMDLRGSIQGRMFLEPNKNLLMTNDWLPPPQLASAMNHVDHSNFTMQHSSSPIGAPKSVLPQKTQGSMVGSLSKWALPETLVGSDMPSLKRDWSTTLMQSVKQHPQILPDFFAQQKATTASKVIPLRNCPTLSEMKCKDFFSQEDSASRVDHQYFNKQEAACGREAQGQLSHNSSLQVDMLKVKVEALSEDFEAARCAESASRGAMGKDCITGDFEGRFSQATRQPSCVGLDVTKTSSSLQASKLMLFAECASTPLLGNSCNVSASVSRLSLKNQPQNSKGLERGKTVPEGDWGEFLAGSKITHAPESGVKAMLPFQQRFEQLQEFLRKCDGADKEYCRQAFHTLSASARSSDHAVELESRALRLSLEEGKEMKRAKLLHVLEEVPNGLLRTPCARPMGPCLLNPKGAAAVKEA